MTAEAIAAVRAHWPEWTDEQIKRHLQQRAALSRMAEEQRRQRLVEAMEQLCEVKR
jgi:hypothetical protein